jgi:NodT family efflux transporter outer membrane factor (OMF) lipoprotein
MRKRTVMVVAMTIALSGCMVGPDYRRPEIDTPADYSGTKQLSEMAASETAELDDWWAQFHDRELDSLIDRAMRGNLDLQTAVSRIREAREQTIVAGAAALPSVNADADVNRTRLSQNGGLSQIAGQFAGAGGNGQGGAQAGGGQSGGAGIGVPGSAFTTYTLGFDASWEIDVFGGVRRAVEAAQARAEQALWESRDSAVSVSAEVASDYFTLRSVQRQIALSREQIERQRQTLALVEARYKYGFVTELDVHQQRTQLGAVEASLPALEAQTAAQIHALAALLGEQPDALQAELAPTAARQSVATPLPVGLPSELLRRRPDIRAAERALAASNAEIGAAVADLFPKFTLSGMFEFVSLDLRNLLDSASRQHSATAAITWPIFSGNRIRANIQIREEQNKQALYAYRKAVIRALQDVEDALSRYANERKRNGILRDTLVEAQSALDVARSQYVAGVVDLTPVLAAQATVLDTQNQLAQSDASLDRDLVSLYKGLGGGWQDSGSDGMPATGSMSKGGVEAVGSRQASDLPGTAR